MIVKDDPSLTAVNDDPTLLFFGRKILRSGYLSR